MPRKFIPGAPVFQRDLALDDAAFKRLEAAVGVTLSPARRAQLGARLQRHADDIRIDAASVRQGSAFKELEPIEVPARNLITALSKLLHSDDRSKENARWAAHTELLRLTKLERGDIERIIGDLARLECASAHARQADTEDSGGPDGNPFRRPLICDLRSIVIAAGGHDDVRKEADGRHHGRFLDFMSAALALVGDSPMSEGLGDEIIKSRKIT